MTPHRPESNAADINAFFTRILIPLSLSRSWLFIYLKLTMYGPALSRSPCHTLSLIPSAYTAASRIYSPTNCPFLPPLPLTVLLVPACNTVGDWHPAECDVVVPSSVLCLGKLQAGEPTRPNDTQQRRKSIQHPNAHCLPACLPP